MRNRFVAAVAIQAGACNPRPIVSALQRAIDEMDAEQLAAAQSLGSPLHARADTDTILQDPAFRLIVHQLAYLCKVQGFDSGIGNYAEAMEICERKAKT